MADYYIIAGVIYQAPDLGSVINSRVVSSQPLNTTENISLPLFVPLLWWLWWCYCPELYASSCCNCQALRTWLWCLAHLTALLFRGHLDHLLGCKTSSGHSSSGAIKSPGALLTHKLPCLAFRTLAVTFSGPLKKTVGWTNCVVSSLVLYMLINTTNYWNILSKCPDLLKLCY